MSDLVSHKFFPLFKAWMEDLENMGYENHWQVLNASEHNVPQNRRRVFLVSIRKFDFPAVVPLDYTLDKILESQVDERYYINADKIDCILKDQPSEDILLVRQATKKGFIEVNKGGLFDSTFPKSKTRRGRVQGNGGDISPTLTASASDCILRFEGFKDGTPIIRRLTEREIFRLMGVRDEKIDQIQESGIGSRQQGKLAGNSIVVDVLAAVFKNLLT